jgi:toxin ParE1/3/4
MRLIISAAAEADLRQIIRYTTTQWGGARARSYVAGLRAKLSLLREHPEMGPAADEVRPGLRRCSYIRHNAFYRVQGQNIRVVRILHKQMQARLHFP